MRQLAIKRRLPVALVCAGALIVASPVEVFANHGGDLSDPDNTTQWVKSPSIVSKTVTARNQGVAQLSRGDINASYCSGDDIWVQDYTYGSTGWYGQTWCDNHTASLRCDIYIVQFDESYYPQLTTSQLRSLGCHEFGHTGSVGHRAASDDGDNNSCMRVEIWPETLDSHDRSSINAGV